MGLLGVGVLVGFRHHLPGVGQEREGHVESLAAGPTRGLPDTLGARPGASLTVAGATEQAVATRVEPMMKDWRTAIINKDPDTVQSLDLAFATYPSEFTAALMASAAGDPEERVRSFSTRVLGKLRLPESAELMRKLLADKSEYVRFNAAWALGELGDRTAVPRLRQLQHRDPSSSVRQSAGQSLRKMEGG